MFGRGTAETEAVMERKLSQLGSGALQHDFVARIAGRPSPQRNGEAAGPAPGGAAGPAAANGDGLHGAVGAVEAKASAAASEPLRKSKVPPGDRAAALAELRAAVAGDEAFTDQMLCRGLRARDWNVAKAAKLLEGYVKWKAAFKPEAVRFADIELECRTGKLYRLRDRDRKGRNVCVFAPGRQNTKNFKAHMHQLVYSLDGALRESNLREGRYPAGEAPPEWTPAEERLCIIFDFTNYSMFNAPPVRTTLETLHILQDCYFERLAYALMVNPPAVFRFCWNLVSPIMDPVTKAKVNFYREDKSGRNAGRLAEVMGRTFHLDKLDKLFGGTADAPYDHEAYCRWMAEEKVKYAGVVDL